MSCGKPHRPIDGQNSVFSVAAILQDFTEFFEDQGQRLQRTSHNLKRNGFILLTLKSTLPD